MNALYLTGVVGLEPTNGGFKVHCLGHLATPQDKLDRSTTLSICQEIISRQMNEAVYFKTSF